MIADSISSTGITGMLDLRTFPSRSRTAGALNSLNTGGSDTLVVTISLPNSAPETMAGASTTLNFTFTGTVRSGTDR